MMDYIKNNNPHFIMKPCIMDKNLYNRRSSCGLETFETGDPFNFLRTIPIVSFGRCVNILEGSRDWILVLSTSILPPIFVLVIAVTVIFSVSVGHSPIRPVNLGRRVDHTVRMNSCHWFKKRLPSMQ